MTSLSVSVIVVSHGRPKALARCLTGLSQLRYPAFETIVVADSGAADVLDPWRDRIKIATYDDENISVARNIGIGQAAGDILAFIDDDAVPEPDWLMQLTSGFVNDSVWAAGGYVVGRNGISLQWGARLARADATTEPIDMTGETVKLVTGRPGAGAKTEGTNMAFRRVVFDRVGGFDPAYRFYLDETDLNLRIAAAGGVTAIVPTARVHHGFAESRRRRWDRVPRSLFEIGASLAVFLRRHGAGLDAETLRQEERGRQKARLLNHMVAGRLEPRDVTRVLATYDHGWTDGAARGLEPVPVPTSDGAFLTFDASGDSPAIILSGRIWQAKRRTQSARTRAQAGETVILFLFSPTTFRHRVQFTSDGVWMQTGGLFGASDRKDRVFRPWSFRSRVKREVARGFASF